MTTEIQRLEDVGWAASADSALAAVENLTDGRRFVRSIAHGSMYSGLYAPRIKDPQVPHDQDEIYVVLTGSGEFVKENQTISFEAGDFIFVEAGRIHRFQNFSEDFSAWAIFWGPHGGESD